jgi:hypothetical protein
VSRVCGGSYTAAYAKPAQEICVDYKQIETGELTFANWQVKIANGEGTVSDKDGTPVAHFLIDSFGHVSLIDGESKFADLALVALRSFIRYGCPQGV